MQVKGGVKQRFLKRHSRVFRDAGAYNRAYEFGRYMKAFTSLKTDELLAAIGADRKTVSVQSASGTINVSTDGTLPVDMANEVLSFVADVSPVRRVAKVIPMNDLICNVLVRTGYSRATFYRDANIGGAGAGTGHLGSDLTSDPLGNSSNPAPTKLHTALRLQARELGDVVVCERSFAADQTAAMGASIAEDLARALAVRENYAAFVGTGAADGSDGGITGLLNQLPAGALCPAPDGSEASWSISAANRDDWLAAILALPEKIEWVTGAREPSWMCSHKFYDGVLQPLKRYLGMPSNRRPGEPAMFNDYEVVFNDLYPQEAAEDAVPLTFGFYDHCMVFGDRQTVEIVPATNADLPDGVTTHHLWARNEVGFRATERADVQFIARGLGTVDTCGVVAGLQLQAAP